jgi:hypothetical protein
MSACHSLLCCHVSPRVFFYSATPAFGAGVAVSALNSSYLAAHSSSLPHRLSVSRVLFALDPVGGKVEATKLASQVDAAEAMTRAQATETLMFLQDGIKASAETIAAFQASMLKKFPFAVAFGAKPNPPKAIDAPEVQQ